MLMNNKNIILFENGAFFRPCVGMMVFNKYGYVFLGKRKKNNSNNYEYPWQMPQGGININQNENYQDAAFRELYEETSIKNVKIIDIIPGWLFYKYPKKNMNNQYIGQAQKWFAFQFHGSDDEINIRSYNNQYNYEFDYWRWEHIDKILNLIVPFKRKIYQVVIKTFHHLSIKNKIKFDN